MKNSKLLFILLLLTGIGTLLWVNPVVFLLILIVSSIVGLFAYTVICIFEIFNYERYGNGKNDYTMIPRKYNIITVFIDWVDSFPQIIKKK